MPSISTSIDISASAEQVWSILMDFAAYPDWNPFIRSIEGRQAPGSRLRVRIEPPGGSGMTFKPVVRVSEPDREFRWLGSVLFRGLFDGEHSFKLQPVSSNSCTFIHGENFTGVLTPMLNFGSMLGNTKAGFEAMNRALKERAESAIAGA